MAHHKNDFIVLIVIRRTEINFSLFTIYYYLVNQSGSSLLLRLLYTLFYILIVFKLFCTCF